MKFNLVTCSIFVVLLPNLIQANTINSYNYAAAEPYGYAAAESEYGAADDFAAAEAGHSNDCSDCFCQCKTLQFTSNGHNHGNCKRMDNSGAAWCYVKKFILTNNGYQYTTCPEVNMPGFQSTRYPGESWSYHACATPTLDDWKCSQCMNRGQPPMDPYPDR